MTYKFFIWCIFVAYARNLPCQELHTMNSFSPFHLLNIDRSQDSFVIQRGNSLYQEYLQALSLPEDRTGELFAYRVRFQNEDTICVFRIISSTNIAQYNAALVINKVNQSGVFISLNKVEVFGSDSGEIYLLGIKEYRELGFLEIFQLTSMGVVRCFDSFYLGAGLFVKNSSLDCISFDSSYLHYNIKEINRDGIPDFYFYGIINYYCNGFEWGIGRLDIPPLRWLEIDFELLSQRGQNAPFPSWGVRDSSVFQLFVR